MPNFTVVEAAKISDKPDRGYGPMQTIRVKLRGEDGAEQIAEWFTKAATPVPSPNSSLVGDVVEGQYGLQFKKAQMNGGGFGSRPEDPKRAARILRQHSQDMAMRALTHAFAFGLIEPPADSAGLFALIKKTADWFDSDANKAAG